MSAIYRSSEGQRQVEQAYAHILDRWPVPSEQRRVPTGQGDTFVLSCGPEGAPPLMLFHGSGANSAVWMFDVSVWSRHFRVHCVDVIGDANFSAPTRPPLAGDAHARWLDDVMEALSISTAAMLGTSLGGWLVLDYASRRPERVTSLVLNAPAGVGAQKNFLLRALPLLLLGSWGRRRMWEMVFGPAPAEESAEMRPLIALLDLLRAHVRPRPLTIPRLSDAALEQLTMPVLAILGGRDVMLDSASTRQRLETHVPQSRSLFYPDAPHVITGQAGLIADFLTAAQRVPR